MCWHILMCESLDLSPSRILLTSIIRVYSIGPKYKHTHTPSELLAGVHQPCESRAFLDLCQDWLDERAFRRCVACLTHTRLGKGNNNVKNCESYPNVGCGWVWLCVTSFGHLLYWHLAYANFRMKRITYHRNANSLRGSYAAHPFIDIQTTISAFPMPRIALLFSETLRETHIRRNWAKSNKITIFTALWFKDDGIRTLRNNTVIFLFPLT